MADTTLSAAQGIADTLAYAVAAGPRERDFLIKIDEEYEFVEWRGNQVTRPWQVQRGYLGSARAAHDSGATVSVEPSLAGGGGSISATVGGVSFGAITGLSLPGTGVDLGGGLVGVGLIPSIIGPFTVAFDTPNISTDGVLLAALPAGSIVAAAWGEHSTNWGGGGITAAILNIATGAVGAIGSGIWVQFYQAFVDGAHASNVGDADSAFGIGAIVEFDASGVTYRSTAFPSRAITANDLIAWVQQTGGSSTQGETNIYALVLTPAS